MIQDVQSCRRAHRADLAYQSKAELLQQVRTMVGLSKHPTTVRQIEADLQDTLLSTGVAALKGSRQVCADVKAAASTTPGLKLVTKRLSAVTTHRYGTTTATETKPAETEVAAPAPAPAPVTPPETKAA